MSCSTMLLTNLKDENSDEVCDYEGFRAYMQNENNREKFVEHLRDSMAYDLTQDFDGQIDYLKSYIPDVSLDSNECIIGAESPERIKSYVRNWNLENTRHCIQQFKNFEQAAEKEGFHTLSDFLSSKIGKNGIFGDNVHYPFHYPASLYSLRKALDVVDGVFTYDSPSNLAYFTYEDDNGVEKSCYGVTMEEDAINAVLAHPERYILMEIVYD